MQVKCSGSSGKPSGVRGVAVSDAELVAHLVECSQVSFLVQHRRPVHREGRGHSSHTEKRLPQEGWMDAVILNTILGNLLQELLCRAICVLPLKPRTSEGQAVPCWDPGCEPEAPPPPDL